MAMLQTNRGQHIVAATLELLVINKGLSYLTRVIITRS